MSINQEFIISPWYPEQAARKHKKEQYTYRAEQFPNIVGNM